MIDLRRTKHIVGAISMSQPEAYDVLVLGSGEGGKCIAWHLAAEGKRVAMIERLYIGGSCPNIACLPSKNVIHSAKVASYFQRSGEFGISAPGWKVDMSGVRARKRAMVEGLVQMHLERYAKTRVGLSKREAKAQGIGYRLGKLPMKMVLRTRTLSEERGFMKALIAADSDRVLGFTAFGVDAGELLPAVQIVISAGLPYTLLRDAVITHPTLAEGFGPLLSTVPARTTT
jgi:pyruvate/2-oxoglutarate dehydrogenase complex dihydrolipoamide dehydrogenase (E3) component